MIRGSALAILLILLINFSNGQTPVFSGENCVIKGPDIKVKSFNYVQDWLPFIGFYCKCTITLENIGDEDGKAKVSLIDQKKSLIYYFEADVPKKGEITRTLDADTALETMVINPVIEQICNQELCKSRININNKDKDQIDYSDCSCIEGRCKCCSKDIASTEENHTPELSDAKVTPECGQENLSEFNFTVIYEDEDDPKYATIRIVGFDGSKSVYDTQNDMNLGIMKKVSRDASHKALYSYVTKLPAKGEYHYYFWFSKGKGASTWLPSSGFNNSELGFVGPNVGIKCETQENHPPIITRIEPEFDMINLVVNEPMKFKAKAEDQDRLEDKNLKEIQWAVDDKVVEIDLIEGTSAEASFAHKFGNAGPYSVRATAIDQQGSKTAVNWKVTATKTTAEGEIRDYDIMINYNRKPYKISLNNRLLLDEVKVFFDEVQIGTIPPAKISDEHGDYLQPTWKDFEVDKMPRMIKLTAGKNNWYKDLSTYVPFAYEKGYGVIDEYLSMMKRGSENGVASEYLAEMGLKIKIEYPLQIEKDQNSEIVVELITSDAKVASTPDIEHNIGAGEITIASVESMHKHDKPQLWVDPIRISDYGWMKPSNTYFKYKELFSLPKDQSLILEGLFRALRVLPNIDWLIEQNEIMDWAQDLEKEKTKDIFLCGDLPESKLFKDNNEYDYWSYSWNFDFFETWTNSANRIKFNFPFHYESSGKSKVAIYIDGKFAPWEEKIFAFEKEFEINCKD